MTRPTEEQLAMREMAKDIRTAQHLAEELGVSAPLGAACADVWDEAAKTLGGTADHTAIGLYLTAEAQG